MKEITRALVSVSDKTGIVDLAKVLVEFEVEILSTGGTRKTLEKAGIPVVGVSEYTGFAEMMDGRVKTLHPKIHAGLLALRNNPDHVAQMGERGFGFIDLVVVNLYPFQQTVAREGVSLCEAIENIDIGGPTMIRAAAKNYGDVAIIVNPARYPEIIEELKSNEGTISGVTRCKLALEAFKHTAEYDAAIYEYLSKQKDLTPR